MNSLSAPSWRGIELGENLFDRVGAAVRKEQQARIFLSDHRAYLFSFVAVEIIQNNEVSAVGCRDLLRSDIGLENVANNRF